MGWAGPVCFTNMIRMLVFLRGSGYGSLDSSPDLMGSESLILWPLQALWCETIRGSATSPVLLA